MRLLTARGKLDTLFSQWIIALVLFAAFLLFLGPLMVVMGSIALGGRTM